MELQLAIAKPLGIFLNEVLFARRCFTGLSATIVQSLVCLFFAITLSLVSLNNLHAESSSNEANATNDALDTNQPSNYSGSSVLWLFGRLFLMASLLQGLLLVTLERYCTVDQRLAFPNLGVRLAELVVDKHWVVVLLFAVFQYFYAPYLASMLFENLLTSTNSLRGLWQFGAICHAFAFFIAFFSCGNRSIRFDFASSRCSLFERLKAASVACVYRAPFRTLSLTLIVLAVYATYLPTRSSSTDIDVGELVDSEVYFSIESYQNPLFGSGSLLARVGNALLGCVALFLLLLFFDVTFELNRVVYQTVVSHYLRIEERLVETSQAPLKLELSSSLNAAGFSTRLPWLVQAICIEQPPLFKYLAALDLKVVAESSEVRRAVVFGRLSYDSNARLIDDVLVGEDPRVAWNTLVTECLSHWRALTQRVLEFNDRHVSLAKLFGDLEYPHYALIETDESLASCGGCSNKSTVSENESTLNQSIRKSTVGSTSKPSSNDQDWVSRTSLQLYYSYWKDAVKSAATRCRVSSPFVNTTPSVAAHSMVTQRHATLQCWLIESLMKLAVTSYDEDTYGVVQCRLGELLNTLFELYGALTINLQLTGPCRSETYETSVVRLLIGTLFPINSREAAHQIDSRVALRETIECCLHSFALKFEHHLTDILDLNPDYACELQRSAAAVRRVDPNHNRVGTSADTVTTWSRRGANAE